MLYNRCMKIVDVNNLLASAQGNVSEFKALKWLVYDKKIPAYELVKTDGRGKPDFIRITTGYGYEVKMLDKKGFIRFPERQYNTIRQLDGMVLVYEHDTDDHVPTPNNQPYETIPFDLLPEPAQCISANGINIYIDPSPDSYYTTIAIESSRKEILETLRGEIENKLHIDFRSWDEMLPQAVYSMLVGLDLSPQVRCKTNRGKILYCRLSVL